MVFIKKLLIAISLTLLFSRESLAYIDPGTGGTILTSLWPVLVGIVAALGAFLAKIFWHPIKRAMTGKKGRK